MVYCDKAHHHYFGFFHDGKSTLFENTQKGHKATCSKQTLSLSVSDTMYASAWDIQSITLVTADVTIRSFLQCLLCKFTTKLYLRINNGMFCLAFFNCVIMDAGAAVVHHDKNIGWPSVMTQYNNGQNKTSHCLFSFLVRIVIFLYFQCDLFGKGNGRILSFMS